jgi:hypothetical protein
LNGGLEDERIISTNLEPGVVAKTATGREWGDKKILNFEWWIFGEF